MITAFDTWTCHICGEERPNDKISVLSKPLVINGEIWGVQNIRYCNDRGACIEGAKEYSFFPGQKNEPAAGYKAMAVENSLLAEESLPIAREEWPDGENEVGE